MSKIQVVRVSVGRVDERTSGTIGLRVSGSLGGKVGELGRMRGAFVLKCQGTQESPASLPKTCKRVPQGCRKCANRIERVPKGC